MKALTIKSDFCYQCGLPFDNKEIELRQSFHHSIPKCLNPKFNIKIPVHQSCHYKINNEEKLLDTIIKLIKKVEQLKANILLEPEEVEEIEILKGVKNAKNL